MYYTAFVLGLLSSLHCVGMCGPIALALPIHKEKREIKYIKFLMYHIGRLLTYGALGTLFGFFGRTLKIGFFQQQISLLLGVIILIVVFIPKKVKINLESYIFSGFVPMLKKIFPTSKSLWGFLLLGIFNGLLPCGMVYMALFGAIATANIYQGTLYMVFFGLGTAPLLLLFNFFQQTIKNKVGRYTQKILPISLTIVGCYLVLKGANLGIPHISLETHQLQVFFNPKGCVNN